MKKLLAFVSFLLTFVMLCPHVAVAAGEMPFSDVKAGKWYYYNVKNVYEKGLMNGVSDRSFDPNGTLTRGMCATIIYRIAGSPETDAGHSFIDVKAGKFYVKAVAWAQSEGIVKGRTEDIFAPNASITRAEFAAILYRYAQWFYLDLPEITSDRPSDGDKIPSYAADAVDALFRSGIINGREDGSFDPGAKITRAEAAAMIDRFVRKAEEKSLTGDDGVLDVMFFGSQFISLPKTAKHFEAIAEGKHQVKTNKRTGDNNTVNDILARYKGKSKESISEMAGKWDVIVLNERYDREPIYEGSNQSGYSGFTELFGHDKLYYNLCRSTLRKSEEGLEMHGLWREIYVGDNPNSGNYKHSEASNQLCSNWRDWLKSECNINRIMVNLENNFDDEVVLNSGDFLHGFYEPTPLYGYCHALALYCTIYNEPCIEQNNGALTYDDIPGLNRVQKDSYMRMIKNLIQEELDFQYSN